MTIAERARELWNIVHQPSFRDMEDDIDKSWSRLAAHFEKEMLKARIAEFKHARKIILMFPERVSEYCENRETELTAELKRMEGKG